MLVDSKYTFILTLAYLRVCTSTYVRFYSHANFTGLLYKKEPSQDCTNLTISGGISAFSVYTNYCIMIYEKGNCQGRSLKVPNTSQSTIGNDLSTLGPFQEFHEKVSAFSLCSRAEGGSEINVDLYKKRNYMDIGAEYKDLCECLTIPKHLRGQVRSLDNHGNCIRLYFEENCEGISRELIAGRSKISDNLSIFRYRAGNKTWKGINLSSMVSIKPCVVSSNCIKLHGIAYKLEYIPKVTANNVDQVVMTATRTYKNNGTSKVKNKYSVKKSIKESFQIQREESLTGTTVNLTDDGKTNKNSKMINFEVEGKLLITVKSKLELQKAIERNLKSSYTKTSTETENTKTINTIEALHEFTLDEEIDMNPCTVYQVSSYVKVLRDVPVNYSMYWRVSGENNLRRSTAQELRSYIKNMTYIDDYDNYTVNVKSEGYMTMTLGLEAVMDAHGTPVEDCHTILPKSMSKDIQNLTAEKVVLMPKSNKMDDIDGKWESHIGTAIIITFFLATVAVVYIIAKGTRTRYNSVSQMSTP